jgi:hypothetical protein
MRHCFNLPSTFFSCVVIVLVTAAAAEVREVAQEQILFDFRDVVMPDPDPLGFPEITYFATTHGERHPPFYSLPIELAIESISRTAGVTDLGALDINLTLRNTGDEPFHLPVSVDPQRSPILSGSESRRIFYLWGQFALLDEVTEPGEIAPLDGVRTLGIRLDGSGREPESLFKLSPGQTILLRIRADLHELWRYLARGLSEVDMQIVATEQTIEDDRFAVAARAEVVSVNAVTVALSQRE